MIDFLNSLTVIRGKFIAYLIVYTNVLLSNELYLLIGTFTWSGVEWQHIMVIILISLLVIDEIFELFIIGWVIGRYFINTNGAIVMRLLVLWVLVSANLALHHIFSQLAYILVDTLDWAITNLDCPLASVLTGRG
jgi:hypothetical protein